MRLYLLELLGQCLHHMGRECLITQARTGGHSWVRCQPMDKAPVIPDAILEGLTAIVLERDVCIECQIAQGIIVPAEAAAKRHIAKHVRFEPQRVHASSPTQGW